MFIKSFVFVFVYCYTIFIFTFYIDIVVDLDQPRNTPLMLHIYHRLDVTTQAARHDVITVYSPYRTHVFYKTIENPIKRLFCQDHAPYHTNHYSAIDQPQHIHIFFFPIHNTTLQIQPPPGTVYNPYNAHTFRKSHCNMYCITIFLL
jgi:hypothetical protein